MKVQPNATEALVFMNADNDYVLNSCQDVKGQAA